MNRIKSIIEQNGIFHAMAAHNPLSAKLAEEAGFNGIWASGFELSAAYGIPDASLLSLTQHLDNTRAMASQVSIPIIADIDTGYGNAINVMHVVSAYEQAGAAAVVMEDKKFPKDTSLLKGGRQELVPIQEFQGKVEAAVAARRSPDFVIIARTEALIAGKGIEEALARADAYVEAGADMILVHSKSKSPDEILGFLDKWSGRVPVVLIPTSYPELTEEKMKRTGKVGVVIYGNHAIRASVKAMQDVFAEIRRDGGIQNADSHVVPVTEIFRLQDVAAMKENEKRYIR
ncbi:phosphonopyruvate hydrolase [Desulfovibrio sp. Fe33]|uniref:phosphonopyruvate hydrolase n=1 Tax=Desulfovibrio sp. Fe33 TaxID=3020842 RepID=UPI00234C95ED|nr:phosphonopyruvate hydrolase [Desulfovibrio sp. Fe33]